MDAPLVTTTPAAPIPTQGTSIEKIILAGNTLCTYDAYPVAPCFAEYLDIRAVRKELGTWFPNNMTVVDAVCQTEAPRLYKYILSGAGRAKEDVLECNESLTNAEFVVRDEAACEFLVFTSYTHFKGWFVANPARRTLHEVVIDGPQKLKFDIDASAEQLDDLDDLPQTYGMSQRTAKSRVVCDTIMAAIVQCYEDVYDERLTDDDITMSESTDPTKFSRHIVIACSHVANHREAKYFTSRLLLLLPAQIARFVDPQVNGRIQNFRLPECCKVGSARVKRCIWGTPDVMIISLTHGTTRLPEMHVQVSTKEIDFTTDEENAVTALIADFTAGLVFDKRYNNLFCYKRIHASHCLLCDRQHTKVDSLYASVHGDRVLVHCRRFPGASHYVGQITGRKKEPKPVGDCLISGITPKFSRIPRQYAVKHYTEEYIRPYDFFGDKYDTLLIKAHMGTGKTQQLLKFIANLPSDAPIIWVSFRRSFSSDLATMLGPSFVDYRAVSGQITHCRVIIQLESLHRLALKSFAKNLLVIIDESESVIGQIENRRSDRGLFVRSVACFNWLIKNATRVIAMDAMANFRTHELLAFRKSVLMHINHYTSPDKSTDYYYNSGSQLLEAIYKAVQNAQVEPIVIVSTMKRWSDSIAAEIARWAPDINIKYYSSDSTEESRHDFEDVNTAWADVDVLIYTSTISAGCSFTQPRFSRVFAYFCAQSVDYMTGIQMLGRVRDVSEFEYHIYIDDRGEKSPMTMASLERSMCTQLSIYNMAVNPLGMPLKIGDDLEYEWVVKDLYYYLHRANLLHYIQSRCNYTRLFQQERSAAGNILVDRNAEETDATFDLLDKHVAEMGKQKGVSVDMIVNSRELTEEDVHAIATLQFPTREDKAAMHAYRLMKCYGVQKDALTEKFIKTYDKPKIRSIFCNMNRMTKCESIAVSIDVWRVNKKNRMTGQSIDDLNTGDNLICCLFATDVLNVLFSDDAGETIYCEGVRKFEDEIISRDVLIAKIDIVIARLRLYADVVAHICGIKKRSIMEDHPELKQKLELVNSVIRLVGVKIKSTSNKGLRGQFQTFVLPLFAWQDDIGRYTVLF